MALKPVYVWCASNLSRVVALFFPERRTGQIFHQRQRTFYLALVANKSARMQGLTLKSLRNHYALVPLFVSVGIGAVWATYYLGRLVLKNPDATWDKKNNPHPWTKIKPDENIKFYAPGGIDFKKLKSNRPEL